MSENIKDKKIAILGNGISGKYLRKYLEKEESTYCTIFDEKSSEIGIRNAFLEDDSEKYDLIVYSPGFKIDHPWLKKARKREIQCIGELDFSSKFFKGEVIAVTGTNGKTTITEFLAHALQHAGIKAEACGNNETPITSLTKERLNQLDALVLEVSSFQAESLQYLRPNTVIFSNIAEDHLDRHKDIETYFRAKWNLVERKQAQGKVYTTESVVEMSEKLGLNCPTFQLVTDKGLAKTVFDKYPFSIDYELVKKYWIDKGYDESLLQEAAKTYQLGENRMEEVAKIGKVTFWNDSKSTNFLSVEGDLQYLKKQAEVFWIGGGRAKGGDLPAFVERIKDKVTRAYFIGENAQTLASLMKEKAKAYDNMDMLLRDAYEESIKIDQEVNIWFSPGFASFDNFQNYKERGKFFKNCVFRLKQSIEIVGIL